MSYSMFCGPILYVYFKLQIYAIMHCEAHFLIELYHSYAHGYYFFIYNINDSIDYRIDYSIINDDRFVLCI